jgi:hypothetical protein
MQSITTAQRTPSMPQPSTAIINESLQGRQIDVFNRDMDRVLQNFDCMFPGMETSLRQSAIATLRTVRPKTLQLPFLCFKTSKRHLMDI